MYPRGVRLARWIVAYAVLVGVAVVAELSIGGEVAGATRYLLIATVPYLAQSVQLYLADARAAALAAKADAIVTIDATRRRELRGDK